MAGKGQQQTADSENDSFGLFIAFADVVYWFEVMNCLKADDSDVYFEFILLDVGFQLLTLWTCFF